MDGSSRTEVSCDPADLIATAIEAEKKAAWFYAMMAEMASDGVARETLRALAEDETSHADTLTGLYVEITGHEVLEPPPAAPEGQPNLFDFPSTSRRAALRFALRNEIRAADLYQSQASATDDPKHAVIFGRLAATEREHITAVQEQLHRLEGSTET